MTTDPKPPAKVSQFPAGCTVHSACRATAEMVRWAATGAVPPFPAGDPLTGGAVTTPVEAPPKCGCAPGFCADTMRDDCQLRPRTNQAHSPVASCPVCGCKFKMISENTGHGAGQGPEQAARTRAGSGTPSPVRREPGDLQRRYGDLLEAWTTNNNELAVIRAENAGLREKLGAAEATVKIADATLIKRGGECIDLRAQLATAIQERDDALGNAASWNEAQRVTREALDTARAETAAVTAQLAEARQMQEYWHQEFLAASRPKERPIEFLSGCPNCGEEPETWSEFDEFDCACGASLVTMVSEDDDDGTKHWWFDLAFEPNATAVEPVAPTSRKRYP